jgi:hypothetical protein
MNSYLIAGGMVLLWFAVVWSQRKAPIGTVEGFGLFGDSTIDYTKLVNDMYTPTEKAEWYANVWSKLTVDLKNAAIAQWDAIDAKEQNVIYNAAVDARKKRQELEVAPPAQASS